MNDCPICTLPNANKLACGHYSHYECVKKAADILQEYLCEAGYPLNQYAKCPICRYDLIDIVPKPPTWYGEITLTRQQLLELLSILESEHGMISLESAPKFITDQMPDAHPEEQRSFAINTASILWLTQNTCIPESMKICQRRDGKQRRTKNRITF
jgi:hypothetical protein